MNISATRRARRRRSYAIAVLTCLCLMQASDVAAHRNRMTLQVGDQGPQVAIWQHMLNLFFITAASRRVQRLAEDGIFGPKTKIATRRFERFAGVDLPPDGVVSSRERILWLGGFLSSGWQGNPPLAAGMHDPRVGHLQVALNVWIARNRLAIPPLWIDTIFGPRTLSAVKTFQLLSGIPVDGVVGPKTWRSLRRARVLTFPPQAYRTSRPPRRCDASDYRVVAQGPDGATGTVALGVRVDPTTHRPCAFKGLLRSTLIGPDGTALPITNNSATVTFSAVLDKSQDGPWWMRSAGAAWVWHNWCGDASVIRWVVEIAGETQTLPIDVTPRCDAPRDSSTLGAIRPSMHGVRRFTR